jgi:Na+-translocating ferredoxin:NAD+ oxidoreductase RnfC subunit
MNVQKIRDEASRALGRKDIKYLIGYQRGSYGFRVSPAFIQTKEEVDRLIFSPLCHLSLTKYLTLDEIFPQTAEEKQKPSKIAIFARGCDSRAINQLIAEKGISRDKLFIIGVPCTGVIDRKKIEARFPSVTELAEVVEENGKYLITIGDQSHEIPKEELLADTCKICQYPNPLIYDRLVGDKVEAHRVNYDDITSWEEKPLEEKLDFWLNQFDRCIRCYACKNACPLCYSLVCILDRLNPQWVKRSVDTSENLMFHISRAFHLAGRCISCGECERACPLDIPLMALNRKLEKDVKDLFGYESGKDAEAKSPMTTFQVEDREDFIL